MNRPSSSSRKTSLLVAVVLAIAVPWNLVYTTTLFPVDPPSLGAQYALVNETGRNDAQAQNVTSKSGLDVGEHSMMLVEPEGNEILGNESSSLLPKLEVQKKALSSDIVVSPHFLDMIASPAGRYPRAWPNPNETKEFSNYLVHVPKSGTSFAFSRLSALVFSSPEYNYYKQVLGKPPYRPCNEATTTPRNFRNKYRHKYKGNQCTLWMSEHPPNEESENNYIILREPKSHVLSQYFHCKESKDHAHLAHLMPSNLTHWLQAWVDHRSKKHPTRLEAKRMKRFRCYRPINLQSRFAGFEGGDAIKMEDLEKRFVVVGDTSQMSLSICAISIEYNGFVPEPCNCSLKTESFQESNGSVVVSPNQTFGVEKEAYNLSISSHGVIHHGNTYVTTPAQDALIDQLTDRDQILYSFARTLLAQKIDDLQARYHVKICRKLGSIRPL